MRSLHWLSPLVALALIVSVASCGGGGGGGGSEEPVVDNGAVAPTPTAAAGRVWTVAEILAEPRSGGTGSNYSCGGELGFRRCVCAPDVPSYVRYRPAVVECNGNAAAILSDRLLNAFSIVVRDSQNRDRWPAAGSGFGGCSAQLADSDAPPKYCSAFKAQDIFEVAGGTAKVYCFGASGYSDIFQDAVRLTVKLNDNPFSNDDDIERYCLAGPTVAQN